MRSLLLRYARLPTFRAVGINTLVSSTAALVAFGANILMTRELAPDARGQVAFVLQLAYFTGPFIMLGVDRLVLRGETASLSGRLTRHLVPLSALATLLLLVIFRDVRAVAGIVALVTGWLTIQRSKALRDHSFATYVRRFLLYQTAIAAGILIVYIIDPDQWFWWLTPYAAPAIAVLVFEIRRAIEHPSKLFGHVGRQSLQLLPATLSTIVTLRAERLLLPLLASNSELGLYIAVATATEPVYWVAQALADHRSGQILRTAQPARLLRGLAKDFAVFAPTAAVVGVVVSQFLVPVFGDAYASSTRLVVPLASASVALALYRQTLAWHLSGPTPGDVSRVETVTALSAVLGYVIGISAAGAIGAAWATLAVYTCGLTASVAFALWRPRKRET